MYTSIFLALASLATASWERLPGHKPDVAPLAIRDNRAPFSRIVAFGDSLTDNGNGSFKHCTQAGPGDCSNKIYGNGTWTNGPVAVSYLADKLGIPLTQDYAWGWNHGGGVGKNMAATIKHSFDGQTSDSQDGFQQVHAYVSSLQNIEDIGNTLHFLWIGNMDITLPRFQYPSNAQWSKQMATMTSQLVSKLVTSGARHIFVPSLYAKQISPSHTFMASEPQQQIDMGTAIQQANTVIKNKLKKTYGDKVIFYDAFDRMMDIWQDHDQYGIDMVGDNFCDGDEAHPDNFKLCLYQGQGDRFYWINFTDMTTRVHELIADDMYAAITRAVGGS